MTDFFESVYETARLAVEKSEPAKVYSVSFQAQNLQHNRRGKVGQFDPQAHALLAQNLSGQWLGGMINLPIHGTALGPENLFYSSDVPGAMEKETELLLKSEVNNPVILFMNGAEGDVAPIRGGVEGIAQIGQSFSQQLQAAMPSMRELSFDWDVQYTRFKLGKAALSIKTCTQGSLKDWIPSWLNLNVSALFPRRVPIAMIRWDGLS